MSDSEEESIDSTQERFDNLVVTEVDLANIGGYVDMKFQVSNLHDMLTNAIKKHIKQHPNSKKYATYLAIAKRQKKMKQLIDQNIFNTWEGMLDTEYVRSELRTVMPLEIFDHITDITPTFIKKESKEKKREDELFSPSAHSTDDTNKITKFTFDDGTVIHVNHYDYHRSADMDKKIYISLGERTLENPGFTIGYEDDGNFKTVLSDPDNTLVKIGRKILDMYQYAEETNVIEVFVLLHDLTANLDSFEWQKKFNTKMFRTLYEKKFHVKKSGDDSDSEDSDSK